MMEEFFEEGEQIYSSSQNLMVENLLCHAYLTNKRIILKSDSEDKIIQYNIDSISDYSTETDVEENPSISLLIIDPQNEIKQIILNFLVENQPRINERDDWIKSLDRLINPNFNNDEAILDIDDPEQSLEILPDNSLLRVCPFCGIEINQGSKFCHKCGAKLNYCSDEELNGLPMRMVNSKSAKLKPKYITEIRTTCNSCGNVYYYGKKEIWENRSKICDNISKEAAAASCCYCNPFINAAKNKNTITDFGRCPKCGSRNIIKEEISHEI